MAVGKSVLAALSRLFSSAVFRELARRGKSPVFGQLTKEIGVEKFNMDKSVSNAFDVAFDSIVDLGNRDEYVYKSSIVREILLGRHNLHEASMLTEVSVNGRKADVVILNGTSTAYEIKSERDNLAKLPGQIESYRNAFASVCVIAAEKHVKGILGIVPDDVGVYTLDQRGRIELVQKENDRPERIKTDALIQVLRVQEIALVLEDMGISVPDVPNTERYKVVQEIFDCQEPAKLHESAVKILQNTRSQSKIEDFVECLPRSLKATVLSSRIRKSDQPRLIAALNTPFTEAMCWV